MKWRVSLVGLAAAAMLAACGGGDTSLGPVNAVKVAGDSLNDSGTFGIKFTVQNTPGNPFKIWADVVSDGLGVPALCARYQGTGPTATALNLNATACTNHAIGGGRISLAAVPTYSAPLSVIKQLEDLAAAGNYRYDELLLVNGGGNDAADLVGAFLAAGQGQTAGYLALLGTLLSSAEVGAAVAGGQAGLAQAGGLYMQRLATRLTTTITTQALDKNAQRVLVMTVPDITRTPRFLTLLAGIGATQSPAVAEGVRQTANAWVQAFNLKTAVLPTRRPSC
jgi:phospholipase/lecithinase/hemolysin